MSKTIVHEDNKYMVTFDQTLLDMFNVEENEKTIYQMFRIIRKTKLDSIKIRFKNGKSLVNLHMFSDEITSFFNKVLLEHGYEEKRLFSMDIIKFIISTFQVKDPYKNYYIAQNIELPKVTEIAVSF